MRNDLDQAKSRSLRRLAKLESEIKDMGKRVPIKRVPIKEIERLSHTKHAAWYLKTLPVEQLFRIWSKLIVQWFSLLSE